jgi:hypothetical protein
MRGKMTRSFPARLLLGLATTATLTACGVHVGWDITYTRTSNLREPVAFASECQAHGGTGPHNLTSTPVSGSCTMPNGDAITCDWGAQTCTTTCQSSPEACEELTTVGVRPFELKRATPAVLGQP